MYAPPKKGERTLGIVGGIAAGAESVRDATKDLEVIVRLVLDEDFLCLTTRLSREGGVGF